MQDSTPPATSQPDKHTSQGAGKRVLSVLSNIGILALAPVIAILLTLFVFQSYQVDGYSMQNTLQNNDRLIVWKGSRTWSRLIGTQYIPNRGDIVVVNQLNLTACGQSEGKQIVKRVIGLPGDRVTYQNGTYTVYNTGHPKGFNPDTALSYGHTGTPLFDAPGTPNVDLTLRKNQLFISGDHRADSCDSRYFGPIDSDQIIGKVVARIFPLNDAEKF